MVAEGLPRCLESGAEEPCILDEVLARIRAGADVDDAEYAAAKDECDQCFWSSDEYRNLTNYGPAMRFAMDWLRRKDLGLEAKDLSTKEEEILLYVHHEVEAAKLRRVGRKPAGDGEPR